MDKQKVYIERAEPLTKEGIQAINLSDEEYKGYCKGRDDERKRIVWLIEDAKIKDEDVYIKRLDFDDGTCFIPKQREADLVNYILEELKKEIKSKGAKK